MDFITAEQIHTAAQGIRGAWGIPGGQGSCPADDSLGVHCKCLRVSTLCFQTVIYSLSRYTPELHTIRPICWWDWRHLVEIVMGCLLNIHAVGNMHIKANQPPLSTYKDEDEVRQTKNCEYQ